MGIFLLFRKRIAAWIFLLILALAVPLAALANGQSPQKQDVTIHYSGTFDLQQEDGPGCSFSGAPSTLGQVAFNIDPNTGHGKIVMVGSGEGVRENRRCGDLRGDLHWSAVYTIEAEGPVAAHNGSLDWPDGKLVGSGASWWDNCTENGEEVSCPPRTSGPFEFTTRITGQADCQVRDYLGDIIVQDIGLPTSGLWDARQEPLSGAVAQSEGDGVFINERPLPFGCQRPVAVGDKLELRGSSLLFLSCSDEFHTTIGPGSGVDNREPLMVIHALSPACLLTPLADQASTTAESALALDLVAGSALVRSTGDSEAVSLATETAETEIAPGGVVMFDLDPGSGESTVSCLAGSALITPANGSLGPVLLAGGEQVAVGADEVSAVTSLPQLYLPAVVAAD